MLQITNFQYLSATPANGPSKTGQPSGGGRGNNPARK